jgi:hypothetical protein
MKTAAAPICHNVQPYSLTALEWQLRMETAKSNLRGNYVQTRVTHGTASAMTAAAKEIDYLTFGIQGDLKRTVDQLRSGELTLSAFGRLRLIALLERPISFARVRIKAKKLGLI